MLFASFLLITIFIPFGCFAAQETTLTQIYWTDHAGMLYALRATSRINYNAPAILHSNTSKQQEQEKSYKYRRIIVQDLEKEKRQAKIEHNNSKIAKTVIIGGLMGMSAFAIY